MENDDLTVEIRGTVDLIKSEACANGLFTGEGMGEMTVVLKDGNDVILTVIAHKIALEGTVVNPETEL